MTVHIYDPAEMAREAAKILIETKSLKINVEHPFTYASGRVAPCYTDCRRLISFPEARKKLMDYAASLITQKAGQGNVDMVAGGETAGIPYAALVAERMNLPMLYVRKKPKGYGAKSQIEGALEEEGQRVVLVEDLQTDGFSKKVFVDALRDAGCVVDYGFVIFHYGIYPASRKNMADMKLNLLALTELKDVLEVAKEANYFTAQSQKSFEEFLADPISWSVAHGGKGDDTLEAA